jgi:hypothetical protein
VFTTLLQEQTTKPENNPLSRTNLAQAPETRNKTLAPRLIEQQKALRRSLGNPSSSIYLITTLHTRSSHDQLPRRIIRSSIFLNIPSLSSQSNTMRFTTLATALLLPLLAIADTTTALTTTLTSTQTLTRTITVSEVVASVTSTVGLNSTSSAGPTAAVTAVTTSSSSTVAAASATKTIPSNYMGAAAKPNARFAASAGMVLMVAVALL